MRDREGPQLDNREDREEPGAGFHQNLFRLLSAIRLKVADLKLDSDEWTDAARASVRDIDALSERAMLDLKRYQYGRYDLSAVGDDDDMHQDPAWDLQPGMVPELVTRLTDIANSFSADTGILTSVRVAADHVRFSRRVREIVCVSVSELLNNVEKHAAAKRVQIRSDRRDDGHIVISVIDDGEGAPAFSWSALPSDKGGFGLYGIQSRLDDIGGHAEIDGKRGFSVRLVVPDSLLAGPN